MGKHLQLPVSRLWWPDAPYVLDPSLHDCVDRVASYLPTPCQIRVLDACGEQASAQATETAQFWAAHKGDANLVPWNGGICSAQHAWLRSALRELDERGHRCFVACHHPIGEVRLAVLGVVSSAISCLTPVQALRRPTVS